MLELLDVDDLRTLLFKAELNTLNEKDSIVNVRLPFAIRLTQKDVAPKGICRLFDTLPHFEARLYYDEESDCAGEADLRKWHASFDDSTFCDLSITPNSDHSILVSISGRPLKSFQILNHPPDRQALVRWLWEYGYKRLNTRAIPKLDRASMAALIEDGDDAVSAPIQQVMRCLVEDRDLFLGVRNLLKTYLKIEHCMYQPDHWANKDAKSWLIKPRDPPFNDLRLYSTCSEGVVEIHACKKPMVSFKILDRPHNWQAMLEWIWDYGNKCHVARCIPQLDPRKMSALLIGNERVDEESCLREKGHAYFDYDYECSSGDDPYFYDLLGAARDYLDEKRTGNGVFHLLLAFQYFRPDIYWDKSSTPHPEGGYEKWHVEFLNPSCRRVHIQPSALEGIVDFFSFDQFLRSFQVCDGPQDLRMMLEWLWNYGNEHKVTRTNRKIRPVTQSSFNVDASSRASPKLRTKHQDESPCKKPLLNHLLRSTYQRAQHQRISRQEYIKVNQQSLSVGVAIHDAEAESPRREPLQVMTLNRQAVSTDHVKLHPID